MIFLVDSVWKFVKIISILVLVLGVAFSFTSNDVIFNAGFILVALGIILFIFYKLGNWWERG